MKQPTSFLSARFFGFVGMLLLCFSVSSLHSQEICPSYITPNSSGGIPIAQKPTPTIPLGVKDIPVVVHLIESAASLSNTEVETAIETLNLNFIASDPNYTIRFHLAKQDPTGRCTDGITHHPTIPSTSQYQFATRWPNDRYLNIYVVDEIPNSGNASGGSFNPTTYSPNADNSELLVTEHIAGSDILWDGDDGVNIVKTSFSPSYPNFLQNTLTHEVGHWLNLLHTFTPCGDVLPTSLWSCCYTYGNAAEEMQFHGDFVPDTYPSEQYYPLNCSANGNCAPPLGVIGINNYMGYFYNCRTGFTDNQRVRMFECLALNRPLIWQQSNLHCTGVSDAITQDEIITQNTTWTTANTSGGVKNIEANLIVKNGATLNIASDVTVSFNGCTASKMIIEVGATVNLYGTLTKHCSNPWNGVEIYGQANVSQQYPLGAQGRLSINGGTIKNAVTGVRVLSGGILSAFNATFQNNETSVKFDPYKFDNKSALSGCVFTIDDSFWKTPNNVINSGMPGLLPYYKYMTFILLNDVRGIHISSCHFQNTRDDLFTRKDYGYGIVANNSGFIVAPSCIVNPPTSCKCTFSGLYEGILINGLNGKYCQIQESQFEKCWTGIRTTSAHNVRIVKNKFILGELPFTDYDPNGLVPISGIYLDDAHLGFQVQENRFELTTGFFDDSFRELYGIYARNLGSFNNKIRKNSFFQIQSANYATGNNTNINGTGGLVYLCNDNTENSRNDFFVSGTGTGILKEQVSFIPNPIPGGTTLSRPTGNQFSYPLSDYFHFDNENLISLNYHHQSIVSETPTNFYNISKITYSQAAQCSSELCTNPPCLSPSELESIRQQLTAIRNTYRLENQTATTIRRVELLNEIHSLTAQILGQTLFEDFDRVDYRNLLDSLDLEDAEYALIEDFMDEQSWTLAQSILNSIPQRYDLTEYEIALYQARKSVYDILLAEGFHNRGWNELADSALLSLENIAESGTTEQARNIAKRVLALYGFYYPPEYEVRVKGRSSNYKSELSNLDVFSIVPNPASKAFRIHFQTESVLKEATVELIDISGRIQIHQKVPIEGLVSSEIEVDTALPGLYFVKVTTDCGIQQLQKLILTAY